MLNISRCIAAVLSTLIVLFWSLCVGMYLQYFDRTDPQRGEVLMVLPGSGIAAAMFGIAVAIIVLLNSERMRRWEKVIWMTTAASGLSLFLTQN